MKAFAQLFTDLDQTNKTNEKVSILKDYFRAGSDTDKLWTLALFTHRRPKRQVATTLLKVWAAEEALIPMWLFDESYDVVGDLAETIALLLPSPIAEQDQPLTQWIEELISLTKKEEIEKKAYITKAWSHLNREERIVFNKLITGGWRIGISQQLIVRVLAETYEIDKAVIAHRITGDWTPQTMSFHDLIIEENHNDDDSKPYPFYLAHPIEQPETDLGAIEDWQVEWKWDGIRGQLIVRNSEIFLWSRGEELITDKFPELKPLSKLIEEGTVLDGEILPFQNGQPLPFSLLQTRIGRKNLTASLLKKTPIHFMVYDILEYQGNDIREWPLVDRRKVIEKIVKDQPNLLISPLVEETSWDNLAALRKESRAYFAEGFMLKRKTSTYRSGRKRGDWWKWKIEPLTIDGVMIYAQKGHGRRAGIFSDYTFGVWDGDKLVSFAKAYSGLTDAEMSKVDKYVKQNTLERFGPVRTVKPNLVFEIAFEGIQESPRHKSGVALRFPRINRWREDKPASEASTLEELKALLALYGV
ncbi:MAG: DNA ligase-1 [Roseivirga sp.]